MKFFFRSRAYFSQRKEFQELIRRNLATLDTKTVGTVCLSYGRRRIFENDEILEETTTNKVVVRIDEEMMNNNNNKKQG